MTEETTMTCEMPVEETEVGSLTERPEETAVGTDAASETTAATPLPDTQRCRPRANATVSEDAYHLSVELPGVDADGLEILLERDVLTLRGTAGWSGPENFRSRHLEFPRRQFERSFRLTDAVERSEIKASLTDGLLSLTLPKSADAKPTRINVTPA